ncbi:MAG: ABC transporter permease [Bacilli bacterium]|jgi:spermidine/putrescine transport system permease protein|nr:ABC transporter permease [Bacilli bacterium]MCH4228461.1 ABC transporter permease [Bacilli bacterium]MCH4277605.1 ABC transporter permease [Bacilli bacterium]MCI2054944.1 ABC transporter permease [Bacilli bacterium]
MVKKASLWKRIFAQCYIWILLILMYLPIVVLMIYSFTTSTSLGTWNGFSFDLYVQLFNDHSVQVAVGNTVIIAVVAATLATLIGTFGAIGVYESRPSTKKAMEFVTQIPVVNPEIVIALSLIVMFVAIGPFLGGIKLSFWTLLAGHLVLTVPFVYLSVKPKLIQMDPALYEAALDLGCTPRQALRKAVFPEILPGVMGGFLIAITLSLDDFIVTAFTRGPGLLSGSSDIQTISTYVEGIIKKHPMPAELRALVTCIFLLVLFFVIMATVYSNVKAKKTKKRKGRQY